MIAHSPELREVFSAFVLGIDIMGERERLAAPMYGEDDFSEAADVAAYRTAIMRVHTSKLKTFIDGQKIDNSFDLQAQRILETEFDRCMAVCMSEKGIRLAYSDVLPWPAVKARKKPKLRLVYSRD